MVPGEKTDCPVEADQLERERTGGIMEREKQRKCQEVAIRGKVVGKRSFLYLYEVKFNRDKTVSIPRRGK